LTWLPRKLCSPIDTRESRKDVDHDPPGQILCAWIAKEELRALCATAARAGHPG
jgi:hypothetical protein